MITQITEERSTCSPRSISGRARTTMVVSTAVISTPVITTASPRLRRTGRGGSAEAGEAGGGAGLTP